MRARGRVAASVTLPGGDLSLRLSGLGPRTPFLPPLGASGAEGWGQRLGSSAPGPAPDTAQDPQPPSVPDSFPVLTFPHSAGTVPAPVYNALWGERVDPS